MNNISDKEIEELYKLVKPTARIMYRKCSNIAGIMNHLDEEDFLSIGVQGVLKKSKYFDEQKGLMSFPKYIRWHAKNAMVDEIRKITHNRRKNRDFFQINFEDFLDEDGNATLLDAFATDDVSVISKLEQKEQLESFYSFLGNLPDKRKAEGARIWFKGAGRIPMWKIGEKLSVTESCICQWVNGVEKEFKFFLENGSNPKSLKKCRGRGKKIKVPIYKAGKKVERRPRGMYFQSGKLKKAAMLLHAGEGIRGTSRKMQMATATIGKLYKQVVRDRQFQGLGVPLCSCGRLSIHRGLCTKRILENKARHHIKKINEISIGVI